MNLGKVVGTIVSSSKDDNLEGMKLLVVQHVNLEMGETAAFSVAVDGIGAGVGEFVLVVTGSSARMGTLTKNRPVDASILAIVDSVEVHGKTVYSKQLEEVS